MTLPLMPIKSQWVGKGKQLAINYLNNLSKQLSIKLAATVGHFFYVTLTLQTFIWLDHNNCCCFSAGSDLIDDSRAQPQDFQEAYLEFILCMVEVGPLSSHVEYICMLKNDSNMDFEDYFQVSLLRGLFLCLL